MVPSYYSFLQIQSFLLFLRLLLRLLLWLNFSLVCDCKPLDDVLGFVADVGEALLTFDDLAEPALTVRRSRIVLR